MSNANKSRTKTPTKRAPKRTAKRTPKTTTTADLLRLKAAEKRARDAYRSAAYDCDPNLSRAIRIREDATSLALAVRDIVSPGPDSGGLMRAMQCVADVARRLEFTARDIERDVFRSEVAS
ncbi:MAG: hypothetical protein HS104_09795 [Polyangiaceae bacterium]|nr:hypothetical protein [Polyangiaceae bacterium]MCE7890381.1 hypothetical protein [Sorangiineae bacterium PRO1]MCL4754378.1 hypothetical protein [Myxococcales bacterium]